MAFIENLYLKTIGLSLVGGPLKFPDELNKIFLNAPYYPLPNFTGPDNLKNGRGKDHPRYGRWIYSFAKFIQPKIVVELGSYAGGTGIGWARAMHENKKGKLVCIDNDSYTKGTYPEITKKNISATGFDLNYTEFISGDSRQIIPEIASKYKGMADIYLVDADHTYTGALADIENGLPMLKSGGYLLVHDVDTGRRMDESTTLHPFPVYEAFMQTAGKLNAEYSILKFIRKHLGIIRVP